jgi:cyclophilin family peptidyl-prolyl cis-trans isomerase
VLSVCVRWLVGLAWAWGLAFGLSGCGGTDLEPSVNGFRALGLQYSRTATFQIGGSDLRNTLVVDAGSACTAPTLAASSSPTLVIVNCTVRAVGQWPVSVRSASGKLLYQATLEVLPPQVRLNTSLGDITLALDPQKAPLTVDNFLGYVASGFYSNTLFHRVIDGFVVQGGGFVAGLQLQEGLRAPVALESRNGLSNLRGTVAMARADVPDSATSQFFINLVDNLALDYQDDARPGYAVFGQVVQGQDVVDTLARLPTGRVGPLDDVPLTDVTILRATQIQ